MCYMLCNIRHVTSYRVYVNNITADRILIKCQINMFETCCDVQMNICSYSDHIQVL